MKHNNRLFFITATAVGITLLFLLCNPAHIRAGEKFPEWLEDFKKEAREKGISDTTLTLLNGAKPDSEIAEKFDKKKQPEFKVTFEKYKGWFLTEKMIEKGAKKYNDLQDTLVRIEKKFGVPPEYLLAIWGLESRYGSHKNTYRTLNSLITLAYSHPRSRRYFRGELLSYLKMHENKDFPLSDQKSSWAGAMGQVQFMPSSYLHYAVDFDGDGWADIWNSEADILASIASYISKHNWDKNQGWGREIDKGETPPANQKLITTGDTNELYFAVTGNFQAIFSYNRSNHYVLTVGLLADTLAQKIKSN
ncbi:MAG: lytic transglycosylase domain-containing protein [bacterium]